MTRYAHVILMLCVTANGCDNGSTFNASCTIALIFKILPPSSLSLSSLVAGIKCTLAVRPLL